MSPSWLQIIVLALLQGAAELLPVSSSAHVIIAEKLMGLNPSRPELTFLLVMLHPGTMFAVIVYFWRAWWESYFSSLERFISVVIRVALATVVTISLGFVLKFLIEKVVLYGAANAAVEELFSNLTLVGAGLTAAGILIIVSGFLSADDTEDTPITLLGSGWIGFVQAVCLPLRGFSRSGATISTALLLGVGRRRAEEFSFALAVVLTPPVVGLELLRLLKANSAAVPPVHLTSLLLPGLVGAACSFGAGLLALGFLSSWLEKGRWPYFGYYCLVLATVVFAFAWKGF